jgi:hypothetical protein
MESPDKITRRRLAKTNVADRAVLSLPKIMISVDKESDLFRE